MRYAQSYVRSFSFWPFSQKGGGGLPSVCRQMYIFLSDLSVLYRTYINCVSSTWSKQTPRTVRAVRRGIWEMGSVDFAPLPFVVDTHVYECSLPLSIIHHYRSFCHQIDVNVIIIYRVSRRTRFLLTLEVLWVGGEDGGADLRWRSRFRLTSSGLPQGMRLAHRFVCSSHRLPPADLSHSGEEAHSLRKRTEFH